jgi:hypothetical protein
MLVGLTGVPDIAADVAMTLVASHFTLMYVAFLSGWKHIGLN